MTASQCWRSLEEQYAKEFPGQGTVDYVPQWSVATMIQIGANLLNMVVEVANIADIVGAEHDTAAFFHTYDFEGAHKIGFIKAHNCLLNILNGNRGPKSDSKSNLLRRTMEASLLPMITVPKPWLGLRQGPYLITPVNLMRCNEDTFQHFALLANANHALSEVYNALNYVSSCPWNINHKVLDIAVELYKTGLEYKDLQIPPFEITIPDRPAEETMTLEDRREYSRLRRLAKKARVDNSSQRSELTTKLSLASEFRDVTFYLPHNMDFRGRAYVVPPYLSHLGNDLARGLLLFGNKKPLGPTGLSWIKIHLANVYGKDKISFADREKFIDDNMEHVFDTADNPLGAPLPGHQEKWWRHADEPWQALAACNEIANAARSPDHTKYMSGFPVHQDGTCNGLQHYAALGGDIAGANAVNLQPTPGSDKPQDVYAVVCKMVNGLLEEHANGKFGEGWPEDEKERDRLTKVAANILGHGPVTRKVIKQTVMTIVYGVTFTGGREQIAKQLRSQELLPSPEIYDSAFYLTSCVFRSIGEMFTAAQAIQKWLSDTARTVALSGEPVTWITPLGLPIVQPYHKTTRKLLQTNLQGITILESNNPSTEPNVRKQETAFPPNFVHSLDSSHMMLTANACQRSGVQFVAVHDSYWTHASTVDAMSRHCREQFVHLHESPILENLSQFFKIHYEGRPFIDPRKKGTERNRIVEITPCPQRGDFDVRKVLESRYFFN